MYKCIGCGIKTETELCERCFRIKNYNDFKPVTVDNLNFIEIIDKIEKEALTVLVIDLLNIPKNFDIIKKHLKSKFILVLTKFDLMPTNNITRYIEYFKKFNLNPLDTIVVSSLNNYNLDYLYENIVKYQYHNVYFVGYTNAGKSSLINKLIYNYSNQESKITTSYMPNTTLDTIEIKLNDFILIDTPGILNKGDITNYLSSKDIKKIASKKKIKPLSFQIKSLQTINIDNFLTITLNNNDIVIYMPNLLNITRIYKESLSTLPSRIINIEKTSDIVIPGLGFIKVMKPGQVKINVQDDIDVFVRDSII